MACLWVCSFFVSWSYLLSLLGLWLSLDSTATVTLQRLPGLGSFPVPSSVSQVTSHCLLWELVLARGESLARGVLCARRSSHFWPGTSPGLSYPFFHLLFIVHIIMFVFDHILSHFYFYFFHHSHPRLFSSVLVPVLFSLSQSSVYVYSAAPLSSGNILKTPREGRQDSS